MLRVLYRFCQKDNLAVRPKFYSKEKCLLNFLEALHAKKAYTFLFLTDGPCPAAVSHIAKSQGELLSFSNIGNSATFWQAYKLAISYDENDLIYFVEDDYVHTRDAILKLTECDEEIGRASYITLYDHPVRYLRNFSGGVDIPHYDSQIYKSSKHEWRPQESTCMTFAARVKVLRKDFDLFKQNVVGMDKPKDRELFRHLQGLSGYERNSNKHLLIGPLPSLATHCHMPWLAPRVKWSEVIERPDANRL